MTFAALMTYCPGPCGKFLDLPLGRQPQFAGFFLWMDGCNKAGNPQDMPNDMPERAEAQRSGCGKQLTSVICSR